ncbi:hypothetical protein F2P79_006357 [Pimephales promelas]|nr:hypothetical protein F2P79_006357 [Pimephales promelas]
MYLIWDGPVNYAVGIIIEGIPVLTNLGNLAKACCFLLGLTYALNLEHKHSYTGGSLKLVQRNGTTQPIGEGTWPVLLTALVRDLDSELLYLDVQGISNHGSTVDDLNTIRQFLTDDDDALHFVLAI